MADKDLLCPMSPVLPQIIANDLARMYGILAQLHQRHLAYLSWYRSDVDAIRCCQLLTDRAGADLAATWMQAFLAHADSTKKTVKHRDRIDAYIDTYKEVFGL